MSSVQERLQLKRVPLDTWNIREQLCLASAVVRSGDQNWMSVSRALKTVGDANRPPDWYSQKSCAAQYGVLLEHVETPKRKKRSSEGAVETPQESILKRLTQERIVEIQKNVAELNQQYEQLKNEVTEARNPATSEERLREMLAEIEASKRARERESARRAAWLKEREERRARAERTWRPPVTPTTPGPVSSGPATPSSPLLTSLLKSSPVVTTPQHISHPANVVETVSPSAGAPTLSMLLEKAGAGGGAAGGACGGVGASSPHENKHAAIEHIKSQLVQIEQQLKASSSPTPPPVLAPAPAVDIDDIEIKAEDVYAFRDIDLHIPAPPQPMHKTPRPLDKPPLKEDELIATPIDTTIAEDVSQDVKEEPAAAPTPAVSEDILPVDIETTEESVVPTQPELETSAAIGFPEVRFPAPEIKVLNDKVKEEAKETESPPVEVKKEQEEEINVEDDVPEAPEEVASEPQQEIEEQPLEVPPTETVEEKVPEDIPLPPDVPPAEKVIEETEVTPEPPLPPEPEQPPLPPEEPKTEPETPEAEETEPPPTEEERTEEKIPEEEIKKDEDAEDSIPLKEMVREESERKCQQPESGKEEQTETEDAHTETDDDTPMELSRVEEMDGKKKRDYSRKKKQDSRTWSGSESAAEASAPESPMASDAERQHRLWKKSVMLVYSRLCAHKYASIFLRPITDEEAPGYSLVVKKPMDFTTIRRNIDAGNIRTTAEFSRDVLLMVSNALVYNSSSHSVYHMAKDMFQEAAGQLGMLVAAQAHAGLSSPAPPARRKRRRDSPPPQTAKRTH